MRRFLFWAVLLFAGATEVDAQSFLERLGQRAARAAEDALTRKAEQAVEQAIDKVSDPETYKKEGQSQDPVGSTIAGQAVVVQSGDGVNFYFELVPPPALDPAWDVIELQNGYYLSETGAFDRTPVDLDAVRLGTSVLNARPGDQWSGDAPVYLLELPWMDYRAEVGVDRDFNGRQCREVLVRIPFVHDRQQSLQVHILCPRPPQGSGDNQSTTAHRYVAPASTEYELVAVRIYRRPGAPPIATAPYSIPEQEEEQEAVPPPVLTASVEDLPEQTNVETEVEVEVESKADTDRTERTNGIANIPKENTAKRFHGSYNTLVRQYYKESELEEGTTFGPELRVFEYYGLINIHRTHKYVFWSDDPPTVEWYRIEVTELGKKYQYTREKAGSAFLAEEKTMQVIMPPWVPGDRPNYGSDLYRRQMNAMADRKEEFGRYYEDGDLMYVGSFDNEGIVRDIDSGKLEAPTSREYKKVDASVLGKLQTVGLYGY